MIPDKATFLAELAKGNPVDLNKIVEVQRQMSELERAGIVTRTGFHLNSPLGNPTVFQPRRILANAIPTKSSS